MRSFCVLAACYLMLLCPFRASAQDHFEVFGGYSYVQANVPITTGFGPCGTCTLYLLNKANLNGWELAGTLRPGRWFGITADFSGYYGMDTTGSGHSHVHLNTFLVGPRVSIPGRISPFAHVLVGAAHAWAGNGYEPIGTTISSSQTSFAAALGGGVDIKLKPFIAVRPIQFDYLMTRFSYTASVPPPATYTQNEWRASAGIVVQF
jgi:opacity protein-like surface antigen